jgi:putative phosphoribosyl transferase
MFDNRKDAGQQLGRALARYKDTDALVLAILKGGVQVGYHVARELNADFSILVARKLPYPDNPEAGFGAIAEDGSTFIFTHAVRWLSKELVDQIIEDQKQEIKRRIAVLRNGRPLPEIRGRTVILVDDGIAMGSTMRTAVMLCKNKKAGKIVVAAPVTGERVVRELGVMVDEVVILEVPPFFQAVAQVYRDWYDVSDREVIGIMERWEREKQKH